MCVDQFGEKRGTNGGGFDDGRESVEVGLGLLGEHLGVEKEGETRAVKV